MLTACYLALCVSYQGGSPRAKGLLHEPRDRRNAIRYRRAASRVRKGGRSYRRRFARLTCDGGTYDGSHLVLSCYPGFRCGCWRCGETVRVSRLHTSTSLNAAATFVPRVKPRNICASHISIIYTDAATIVTMLSYPAVLGIILSGKPRRLRPYHVHPQG